MILYILASKNVTCGKLRINILFFLLSKEEYTREIKTRKEKNNNYEIQVLSGTKFLASKMYESTLV